MKFSDTMITKTPGSVFPVLSYNLHELLLGGVCTLAALKALSGSRKDKMLCKYRRPPQECYSLAHPHKAKQNREKFMVFFQLFPLLCKHEELNT